MGRRRPPAARHELGPVVRRSRSSERRGEPRHGGAIFLSAVILIGLLVAGFTVTLLHGKSSLLPGTQRGAAIRVVLFVIPGASPESLKLAHMPVLARLERSGTTYPQAWIGQAPGTALTSAVTLATGSFPRAHGVVGTAWQDPHSGNVVHPGLPVQAQLGALDQIMEAHTSVVPVASVLKDRRPRARVLSVSGGDCASADAAGSWLSDYALCFVRDGKRWVPATVAGHALPPVIARSINWSYPVAFGNGLGASVDGWRAGLQDDAVARYARFAIAHTDPALTVVQFPEPAGLGEFVPAARRARMLANLLSGIDRDMGRIIEGLKRKKRFQRTVFAVTSTQVESPMAQALSRSTLSEAIIAAGGQEIYLNADGMAAIGLQDPLQSQPVAQVIEGEHLAGVDAIYYKSDAHGAWTYHLQYEDPLLTPRFSDATRYLLSTLSSDVAPDVVIVYSPHTGTSGVSAGTYSRTEASAGLQWDTLAVPLVLSGQGINPGVRSAFPARLVDLAPTIEAVLGLRSTTTDGIVLSDAMVQPASSDTSRQQSIAKTLAPLVDALQSRTARPNG